MKTTAADRMLAEACELLGAVLRCEDVHTDEDWVTRASSLLEECDGMRAARRRATPAKGRPGKEGA